MRFFLLTFFFILAVTSVATLALLEYWSGQSGSSDIAQRVFVVQQGENAWVVSKRLEEDRLIRNRFGFLYALARLKKLDGGLVAGEYLLPASLSAREIALRISTGQALSQDIKITFPEGFTAAQMANRLTEAGLPGEEFLRLVRQPSGVWRAEFPFLKTVPYASGLEGFLFPDTYRFDRQANAETIVSTLLETFLEKAWPLLDAKSTAPFDTVILSSIVETEVRSDYDRALVADLFLRRLAARHSLESDATVKYILGVNKVQHSFEETRTDSPYNTYINKGLPPGPISNPGLSAIRATLTPIQSNAFYFLSDPVTGETVFSKTFEEHVRNKRAHGL